MSSIQVLMIAGTHGNEINAPWIFDQLNEDFRLIDSDSLKLFTLIGNPDALQKGSRYIDRDLNRSFSPELLSSSSEDLEICRAKDLLFKFGPSGQNPCQVAIDFHSTTSSMGSSLVIYGRRPVDLAIAALIQKRLGLPIYLYESDESQKGFLVESWPCGIVVEIGPVPQGVINSQIINQTLLILNCCLDEISSLIKGSSSFPEKLVIHRHLKHIDFPRNKSGTPSAFIHPDLQGKDWHPIKNGQPLFCNLSGDEILLCEESLEDDVCPVFINEAAYSEKNIAMSLTKKESWYFDDKWSDALESLLKH